MDEPRRGRKCTDEPTGPTARSRMAAAGPQFGDTSPDTTTRRHLLMVSGGVLVGTLLSSSASAADGTHYVLGAKTSHWAGEEPSEIAGQENPTLRMTVGEEYTITWHNRDGNYHRLLIRDENSEVLERSPGNNEEGGTESVTFVATDEMDNYQCEPHFPMNGDLETGGDSSSTATADSTPTRRESSNSTPPETQTGTETSTTEPTTTADSAAGSDPATTTAGSNETATSTEGDEAGQATDGSLPETPLVQDEPDDQPVFGVGSLLAGLGGVGYLFRRRFRTTDD